MRSQEEDDTMDVDEETDSRQTLEMRKRNVIKDMRMFEGIKCMDEAQERD